jgi:hypothetical protein
VVALQTGKHSLKNQTGSCAYSGENPNNVNILLFANLIMNFIDPPPLCSVQYHIISIMLNFSCLVSIKAISSGFGEVNGWCIA